MVKLNKIILKCFMKHDYLELNFYEDINLIKGDTAAGKSCIFKAIRWLHGNSDVSKEDFIKEGCKSTSVIGHYNNGYILERVRSASVNRYIIKKEGCDDEIFDNFGKDIPEKVKEIIGTELIDIDDTVLDLNFADQEDLNFIFSKTIPASFCAKLFNKFTGSELLDNLFSLCNKDNLSVKKEISSLEESIKQSKIEIAEKQINFDVYLKKSLQLEENYVILKEKLAIFDKLSEVRNNLKRIDNSLSILNTKKINVIDEKTILDLKQKADRLTKLSNIYNRLKEIDSSIEKLSMQSFPVVNVNWEEIRNKYQRINNLKQISVKLKNIDRQIADNIQSKQKIEEDLEKGRKELEEIWLTMDICPLCKHERNKKC